MSTVILMVLFSYSSFFNRYLLLTTFIDSGALISGQNTGSVGRITTAVFLLLSQHIPLQFIYGLHTPVDLPHVIFKELIHITTGETRSKASEQFDSMDISFPVTFKIDF